MPKAAFQLIPSGAFCQLIVLLSPNFPVTQRKSTHVAPRCQGVLLSSTSSAPHLLQITMRVDLRVLITCLQ